MASIEKDSVSGQMTTGHEWDGIKELNTPLPKWWVYVFWACVIWSVAYWVAMPAWPTISDYSRGMLGYSSRADLDLQVKEQQAVRAKFGNKLATVALADVSRDKDLLNFAMAGGKFAFNENCAPCHAAGGNGVPGAYPRLADDEWIWGGALEDILHTISYGVRNEHPESRQGAMPAFSDGLLAKEEIDQVADYVVSVAKRAPAAGTPGETIFAEQCAACHAEDGSGGKDFGAPALNNEIWLFKGGKDGIVAQVTKARHGEMPAWAGRLDEATIKMLTVYVHSLGGGQ